MKTTAYALLFILILSPAYGEFRTWTRSDGKTAELELLSVTEAGGEKSGSFKMRNGKTAVIKASDLIEGDAKLLGEWKPSSRQGEGFFDEAFKDNLLQLSGRTLQPMRELKKPEKYYLFYYTASWCGPCQSFTPLLVKFYETNKNDSFEVILISSDQSQKDMQQYAVDKKMPWPHLKFSKVKGFKKEFNHPGTGIPNLVLCDIEGNVIKSSYVKGQYYGPVPVMNHLGALLKQ